MVHGSSMQCAPLEYATKRLFPIWESRDNTETAVDKQNCISITRLILRPPPDLRLIVVDNTDNIRREMGSALAVEVGEERKGEEGRLSESS